MKQIEVNQQDESSDSSEDEDSDTPDEVRKSRQSAAHNRFSYSEDAQKRMGMSNGTGPARQGAANINRKQTVRRTKQKGYWHGFLTGLLEK